MIVNDASRVVNYYCSSVMIQIVASLFILHDYHNMLMAQVTSLLEEKHQLCYSFKRGQIHNNNCYKLVTL